MIARLSPRPLRKILGIGAVALFLAVSTGAQAALVADSSGNVYLEENNSLKIIKISPDGTKKTFATSDDSDPINGELAVDAAGNIYASAGRTTIVKFSPDGKRSTFATGVGTNWPDSMVMDAGGNLFVGTGGAILKIAPDGTKSPFASGVGAYGLAFDKSGNLFASDSHGEDGHLVSAIVKFAPDGSKSAFAPDVHGFALAFDSSGNLYADGTDGVLKFTPDGKKSIFAREQGGGEGLTIDSAGNIVVSTQGKIVRLDPNGAKVASASKAGGPPASEADVDEEEDSPRGLNGAYAKNYLIAVSTLSPDKKFALIYPTADSEEVPGGANQLVSLKPFTVLGKLNTKWPYFKNESHGGLSASWSEDNSVALVTLDGKWGPRDIFVLEVKGGKLARATNLTVKMHDLLEPDYRQAKAKPYNGAFDFIFDSEDHPICQLDGNQMVKINARATTDPNSSADGRAWDGQLEAVWNIPQAKFVSHKVTRTFAGVRKHED